MTWQTPRKGTWKGRPGQSMATRGTPRWVLHRWSDTGETSLRLLSGSGRDGTLVEHEHHSLGTTATWAMAICAADVIRRAKVLAS